MRKWRCVGVKEQQQKLQGVGAGIGCPCALRTVQMLCGAAPFEYVVLDDECELDECDDFATVSSF